MFDRPAARLARAVFLDRDGTLIRDRQYDFRPDALELVPGAGPALRRLRAAGFRLVVVTNQSGVARGYFDEAAVRAVHRRLAALLAVAGAPLDACYYCPHHPAGPVSRYAVDCACRKPRPGLLLGAAADLAIDLARSWMVGDIWDDCRAGAAAGCRTVLVSATEPPPGPGDPPAIRVHDLAGAARAILTAERTGHAA